MKREYVIKLTDEEKEALRQSELVDLNTDTIDDLVVNNVVEQILAQNNSAE
jgi:hypothetical protein